MGAAAGLPLPTGADGVPRERGNNALRAGRPEEAVLWYLAAAAAAPDPGQDPDRDLDRPKAYSNASAALLDLGRPADALHYADLAAADAPRWAKAHFRRGRALLALGDGAAARDALERATALDPDCDALGRAAALAPDAAQQLPAAAAAAQSSVLAWGRCEHMGLRDVARPRPVRALAGRRIADVACGATHALAVGAADGSVWAWGLNAQGQCTGSAETVPEPALVSLLAGERVRAVACGAVHSVALTEAGAVRAWGADRLAQLGAGLPAEGAVSVAAGLAHTVVVLEGGRGAVAWGWNEHGQLGVGSGERCVREPLPLTLEDVRHVACGAAHTAVVAGDGRVYTAGSGSSGQLGRGDLSDSRVLGAVDGVADCALVACGEEFTVAATAARAVFAWGLNNVGQLGLGVADDGRDRPTEVEALRGADVELLACSQGHVFALARDGAAAFEWGLPGADSRLAALDPSLIVPAPRAFAPRKRLLRVECGRTHYVGVAVGALAALSELSGARAVAAGRKLRLRLQARDELGEACTAGGDAVLAPGAGVDDNLDGSYDITFAPTRAGVCALDVLLNGEHVAGSPVEVAVEPGPVHGPSCVVWPPPGGEVVAGARAVAVVAVRDAFGNSASWDEVSLVLAGGAVSCVASTASNGTLAVTFSAPEAVGGAVQLFVDGEPLPPFELAVRAGPAARAEVSGDLDVRAGELALLSVRAFDACGNSTRDWAEAADMGFGLGSDGCFEAALLLERAGEHVVDLGALGSATVCVRPGPVAAHRSRCRLLTPGPLRLPDAVIEVELSLCDAFGNPAEGFARLRCALAGDGGNSGEVVDVSGCTATVRTPGTYELTASTADGELPAGCVVVAPSAEAVARQAEAVARQAEQEVRERQARQLEQAAAEAERAAAELEAERQRRAAEVVAAAAAAAAERLALEEAEEQARREADARDERLALEEQVRRAEATRRRAAEALRREQTARAAAEEIRRRAAGARRVGGGFAVQFSPREYM